MTEQPDWTHAPSWAKWHTEDRAGRAWWQKRPKKGKYTYYYPDENDVAEYLWYDEAPCDVMKMVKRQEAK